MDLEQIRQGPSIFQRSEIAHPVAVAVAVVGVVVVGFIDDDLARLRSS